VVHLVLGVITWPPDTARNMCHVFTLGEEIIIVTPTKNHNLNIAFVQLVRVLLGKASFEDVLPLTFLV
jgi:hypothetical protein